jgi:hypothetical protein
MICVRSIADGVKVVRAEPPKKQVQIPRQKPSKRKNKGSAINISDFKVLKPTSSPNISKKSRYSSSSCFDGFEGNEAVPTGNTMPVKYRRRPSGTREPKISPNYVGRLTLVKSRTFGKAISLESHSPNQRKSSAEVHSALVQQSEPEVEIQGRENLAPDIPQAEPQVSPGIEGSLDADRLLDGSQVAIASVEMPNTLIFDHSPPQEPTQTEYNPIKKPAKVRRSVPFDKNCDVWSQLMRVSAPVSQHNADSDYDGSEKAETEYSTSESEDHESSENSHSDGEAEIMLDRAILPASSTRTLKRRRESIDLDEKVVYKVTRKYQRLARPNEIMFEDGINTICETVHEDELMTQVNNCRPPMKVPKNARSLRTCVSADLGIYIEEEEEEEEEDDSNSETPSSGDDGEPFTLPMIIDNEAERCQGIGAATAASAFDLQKQKLQEETHDHRRKVITDGDLTLWYSSLPAEIPDSQTVQNLGDQLERFTVVESESYFSEAAKALQQPGKIKPICRSMPAKPRDIYEFEESIIEDQNDGPEISTDHFRQAVSPYFDNKLQQSSMQRKYTDLRTLTRCVSMEARTIPNSSRRRATMHSFTPLCKRAGE